MTAAIARRAIGPGDSSQASLLVRRQQQGGAPGAPAYQPPEAPRKRRDFFAYPILFSNLTAGNAAQGAIQIQSDSDFELQKLTMFADIAQAAETEATRVLPLVTVQITDSGTGRKMFSAPVPVPAIMGDGRIPFILPSPKVYSPNASITIDVANFAAATDYNLRILLIGAKIFSMG
jgi:hypothetical protein